MNNYAMESEVLRIGEKRPKWIGVPDGCIMEYTDTAGLLLFAFMDCPTAEEIEAFETRKKFEISFSTISGVGFFTVKFGDLPRMDCPFSPNLYSPTPVINDPEPGQGLALNIMLIDSSKGELKKIRLIGLGKEFSLGFIHWCRDSLKKTMDRSYYDLTVNFVFQRYTTDDIWRRSFVRWNLLP